jgi:hypothetical protein
VRPGLRGLFALLIGAFVVLPAWAADVPTRLPGGTRFTLELAHHITSGRTPAGSPVFFRVADDVIAGDRVVIRKGTVVEGRMQAIGNRGVVGTSGSINFGVRYVPAVDGQNIRVLATVANQGRSRDGAVVGWVIMWGIFGLVTKGVDAYALRGAPLEAEVLSDRDIKSEFAPQVAPETSFGRTVSFVAARVGKNKIQSMEFSLERATEKQPLALELPQDVSPASVSLVSVNGISTIKPVAALRIAGGRVEFDAWDVIKYCDHGSNDLRFEIAQADGSIVEGIFSLAVQLKRKQT